MASAIPQFDRWFEEAQVQGVADRMGDPPAVRSRRLAAFQAYHELPLEPNPLYRKYVYFGGVDLTGVGPDRSGLPVALPPTPENTLRVVHDASGTRIELPDPLRAAGVRAESAGDIWKNEGSTLAFLGPIPTQPDKLGSLLRALQNRGVQIDIPDRCTLPVRIQDITVLSQPGEAISVHRAISAGENTRVLASEEVYSTGGAGSAGQRLYGSSVRVNAAAGASVHFLTVHAPDLHAVSLYERVGTVGKGAKLAWLWSGFGGFRTRAKMLTELPGQGSEVEDLQTFYGVGQQTYDSAVQITHQGTDTRGQSITRGLFQNESRGMSRGLVRIEKEARKTLSFLSEHAMLLSRGARSETIPVLEILCRDVKATHSSSVAPVDPEKVFYLESSGLAGPDAIRMIGEGFLSHVLERAPVSGLREILYPALAARWEGREITWGPEQFPAMPPLSVLTEGPSDEWRFDAKLR
ncbi:MAG: SufD family Fe-S cluster assembly protein [Thermoplasmata archaeon]|nr:SufD family Fe-S cluster assembly protein [Thermoplasmata archaeon]